MTDYLHDLQFGSFLTPDNRRPDDTVALAVLSEQIGLDLVTFQDHPYQPSFLDTWTLLSYVAARTSTVRLSPNVLNVPLRPPAVLARSAASLDLLSGGRVDLALGAGAFWDAIVAMGVPRLSPGESVVALAEAIEVIRQIWAADARGGVRVDGIHHQVQGAKRGPAPSHEIGLWVGALKPRMLRLIGRSADGWLPSLLYLQPGDLARGNAVIDEAATEAGRDPGRALGRRADTADPHRGGQHVHPRQRRPPTAAGLRRGGGAGGPRARRRGPGWGREHSAPGDRGAADEDRPRRACDAGAGAPGQ